MIDIADSKPYSNLFASFDTPFYGATVLVVLDRDPLHVGASRRDVGVVERLLWHNPPASVLP